MHACMLNTRVSENMPGLAPAITGDLLHESRFRFGLETLPVLQSGLGTLQGVGGLATSTDSGELAKPGPCWR